MGVVGIGIASPLIFLSLVEQFDAAGDWLSRRVVLSADSQILDYNAPINPVLVARRCFGA